MAARFTNRLRRLDVVGRLIAINLALFLVTGLLAVCGKIFGFPTGWIQEWLSLPSMPPQLLTHLWTLLTYMFTQYSFLHLLFNMLWLWWFGGMLLQTMRDRYVTGVYICGGLSGALFFLLGTNLIPALSGPALLNGSSASVMAVMAVCAFRSPDYEVRLFLLGSVKLKWLALACILLAFLGLGGGNAGGEMAHLGGVAFGALYGVSLRRGHDWLKPVLYFETSRPRKAPSPRQVRNAAKAMNRHRDDTQRLDELLDRIRVSGFDSLSRKEREELQQLSEKLKK